MLHLSDFDFYLPKELIAQHPANHKNQAKLLEVNNTILKDYVISDLEKLINPNDLLVANNTKVIKSRIVATHKNYTFILTLHKQLANGNWLAFTKPVSKINPNEPLCLKNQNYFEIIQIHSGGELELEFHGETSLNNYLDTYGFMPLPPYIKRQNINSAEDIHHYQSIFAKKEGAVAAPTASLHFSDELLKKLTNKGVQITEVTLHVGAGTFLPVKTENILEHKMHSEYGEISPQSADLINQTKKRGGRIIAVGTTSLRILEHVATLYDKIVPFRGETQIFIYPGFKFKIVDKLITNFHTPKSTLLMLVAAFAGLDNIKKAYQHAITKQYRFFSYGDCTFLHKADK